MNKCEVCHKKKPVLWFNILAVCQDCYNKLIEREMEKANEKKE